MSTTPIDANREMAEKLLKILAEETKDQQTKVILVASVLASVKSEAAKECVATPVPMLIYCPECGARHIDEGAFATKSHHTHACQTCGACFRTAIVPTVGVRFLPGFKNAEKANG